MQHRDQDHTHPCPTLEMWCAYVDGSLSEAEKQPLAWHLQQCDQCFSTVASVRQGLAGEEGEITPFELLVRAQGQKSRPGVGTRRWYAYAAAVLVLLLGGLYFEYRESSEPMADRPFLEAPLRTADELGFAEGGPPPILSSHGSIHPVVVFAQFDDEVPDGKRIPSFAPDLFDPEMLGSFAHFYHTMSFGQLQVQGTVLPKRYASKKPRSAYLITRPNGRGRYDQFALDILEQVDADYDLGPFDNDGADGIPNSGDDDGMVDYVFIILRSVPTNFLYGPAEGVAGLGFEEDYSSTDTAPNGTPLRISGLDHRGTVLKEGQGKAGFAWTVSVMAHEFGHSLGLPDLFDRSYLDPKNHDQPPSEDSAGIGRWGLMSNWPLGWHGDDGPIPFCAWSLEQLGWIGQENERLVEVRGDTTGLAMTDLQQQGFVYKIRLKDQSKARKFYADEYLLLEHRVRTSNHYNRNLPQEGVLVWHMDKQANHRVKPMNEAYRNNEEEKKLVDLVCADGLYRDRGYPEGRDPDPQGGRDNLDFWARDKEYARSHEGNTGDATDIFDGLLFTRFDLLSNPSAATAGLQSQAHTALSIRMQRQGDIMLLDIEQPRWSGTIGEGEDVFWMGEIIVDGDLTIAPKGRLIIDSNTRVRFAGTDRLQSGKDPSRCEILVQGSLRFKKKKDHFTRHKWGRQYEEVATEPVVFEALVPGETWYGIMGVDIPEGEVILKDALHGLPGFEATEVVLEADVPTAVEDELATEELEFELRPNYPNPFSLRTTIPYTLAAASRVRLVIYNALGQQVRRLVDEEQLQGEHEAIWDSRDEGGQGVASGVYLYHLEVPGEHIPARKMLVLDGGLSQVEKLDAALRAQGRDWSVLQAELVREIPEVFGYATEPELEQVAFTTGIVWTRLQALGQYGGDLQSARSHAEQLEELLRYFEASPAQLQAAGNLAEAPELLAQVQQDLAQLVQGHSEAAAAYFFLGQWLEGLKTAGLAARRLGTPLSELVDLDLSSGSSRQLAAYLDSLEAGAEPVALLRRLAGLLESNPSSRSEVMALLDVVEELVDALTGGL